MALHAQTATPAHKPANSNAAGSAKGAPAKTSATPVTKKIAFAEDTFASLAVGAGQLWPQRLPSEVEWLDLL